MRVACDKECVLIIDNWRGITGGCYKRKFNFLKKRKTENYFPVVILVPVVADASMVHPVVVHE